MTSDFWANAIYSEEIHLNVHIYLFEPIYE